MNTRQAKKLLARAWRQPVAPHLRFAALVRLCRHWRARNRRGQQVYAETYPALTRSGMRRGVNGWQVGLHVLWGDTPKHQDLKLPTGWSKVCVRKALVIAVNPRGQRHVLVVGPGGTLVAFPWRVRQVPVPKPQAMPGQCLHHCTEFDLASTPAPKPATREQHYIDTNQPQPLPVTYL